MAENGSSGLAKTEMTGEKKVNGICHDDSSAPVRAKTLDELHSLQKKRVPTPTSPDKGALPNGTFAPATSQVDRHTQQLQSISASLASLTRETGPKVVKGDPAGKKASSVLLDHVAPTDVNASDSALKFTHVLYNLSPAELYEQAIKYEKGSFVTSTGALATLSGAKTGRSPRDKRVVKDETTKDELWWGKGSPNIEMDEHTFLVNRERAVDYLNSLDKVYVNDQFLNWDPANRIKVRIVSARAYHSLFMHNMCIRPTASLSRSTLVTIWPAINLLTRLCKADELSPSEESKMADLDHPVKREAENCDDAEVIFKFLDSNGIRQTHSGYYLAYALHMEAKHKIKTADEIFNCALSIDAQPREKLEAEYRKFLFRTMRSSAMNADEESTDYNLPVQNFGTILSRGGNSREVSDRSNITGKSNKNEGGQRVALSIYKDENAQNVNDPGLLSSNVKEWSNIASQKDRNKENKAIPSKWTSHKIPQRPVARRGAAPTPRIEVFVDDEYSKELPGNGETQNSSKLQIKEGEEQVLKRESELSKQKPLRNFPACSLPR